MLGEGGLIDNDEGGFLAGRNDIPPPRPSSTV